MGKALAIVKFDDAPIVVSELLKFVGVAEEDADVGQEV